MSFFEQVISKVFPKASNKAKLTEKNLSVQEKLQRSDHYLAKYEKWLQDPETEVWLDFLKQSIKLRFNGIEGPNVVQTFSMDATRGFAIMNKEEVNDERLSYLLHHLYLKLSEIKYVPQKSGRIIEDRGSFVQTQEGYYMKPNVYLGMGHEGKGLNQLYGNVTLELVYANKRSSYLKVVTTWYVDHNFDSPLPYSELIEKIFSI